MPRFIKLTDFPLFSDGASEEELREGATELYVNVHSIQHMFRSEDETGFQFTNIALEGCADYKRVGETPEQIIERARE